MTLIASPSPSPSPSRSRSSSRSKANIQHPTFSVKHSSLRILGEICFWNLAALLLFSFFFFVLHSLSFSARQMTLKAKRSKKRDINIGWTITRWRSMICWWMFLFFKAYTLLSKSVLAISTWIYRLDFASEFQFFFLYHFFYLHFLEYEAGLNVDNVFCAPVW